MVSICYHLFSQKNDTVNGSMGEWPLSIQPQEFSAWWMCFDLFLSQDGMKTSPSRRFLSVVVGVSKDPKR